MGKGHTVDKVEINIAGPSDSRALAALHHISHRDSFEPFSSPTWIRSRDPQQYLEFWSSYFNKGKPGDRTWKASMNGVIVGTVTLMPLENCSNLFRPADSASISPKEIACLRLMYVHPGYMRKGIGRRLLNRFHHFLEGRKYVMATLITHAANDPARSFYEALGWKLDGIFTQQVKEFFNEPLAMRERARYRYLL